MPKWPVARIEYTVPNITTGEDWTHIEVAPQWYSLAVPAEQAKTIVALINDAHSHLATALEKCAVGDPGWRDHISRVAGAADELQRMGRPRASKKEMVSYRRRHGLEAAMRKYNVTAGTLDKYERELEQK